MKMDITTTEVTENQINLVKIKGQSEIKHEPLHVQEMIKHKYMPGTSTEYC
jgi:hypothetical protein